jgi:peptide/nickel transport system ATP-binding protein
MITHDLGIVSEVCDDVAVIYAGQIVECGKKEEIFDHPAHPYTRGLFESLPDLSKDVKRLNPIRGLPPDPTNLPIGCKFAPRCPYVEPACTQTEIQMAKFAQREHHLCRCRVFID